MSQSTPTLPQESEAVTPAGSTSDLTPTSRDALVTDKPIVKSLFNSRTEAAKSLEILQSEGISQVSFFSGVVSLNFFLFNFSLFWYGSSVFVNFCRFGKMLFGKDNRLNHRSDVQQKNILRFIIAG